MLIERPWPPDWEQYGKRLAPFRRHRTAYFPTQSGARTHRAAGTGPRRPLTRHQRTASRGRHGGSRCRAARPHQDRAGRCLPRQDQRHRARPELRWGQAGHGRLTQRSDPRLSGAEVGRRRRRLDQRHFAIDCLSPTCPAGCRQGVRPSQK